MADKVIQSLVYKLIADEADLVKSLKDSEKRLDALGDKFISVGKKASLGLTVPLVAAGAAMVNLASETQDSINAVNVIFKSGAKQILDYGEVASETAGLSKSAFNDVANSFGNLLAMSSTDMNQVSEDTIALTQRAADLASLLGGTTKDAAQALGSALRGEAEPARRYGILLSENAIQSKAMAMGISDGSTVLTEAQKVQVRYNVIMEQSAKAAGDFSNTNKDFKNSLAVAKAQVSNLATEFGEQLLPLLSEALTNVRGLLREFSGLSDEQKRAILITAGLAAAIGPLLVGIGNTIKMMSTLKVVMAAASGPAGWIALTVGALALLGVAVYNNTKYLYDYNAALEGTSKASAKVQLGILTTEYNKLSKELNTIKNQQKDAGEIALRGASGLQDQADALQKVVDQHKARIDVLQKEVDAQESLNLGVYKGIDPVKELTKAENSYSDALDIANKSIDENKTEIEKLGEQFDILANLKTSNSADEEARLKALAIIRSKIYALELEEIKKTEEAKRSESQATYDYIAQKTAEYRETKLAEVAQDEAIRQTEIAAEKAKVDEVSGYVQAGIKAVGSFADAAQRDITESWDDLAQSALELTATIAKSTGTEEGYIVAAIAEGLTLIVDLVDSAINYQANLELEYADTIAQVNSDMLSNRIKTLDEELKRTLAKIDAEEKAALEAAGFIEDTEVQSLEKQLAEETDLEKKSALEKAIAKAKIEEEYQKKREKAEADADKARRKLEYDRAVWERKIMLAKIEIDKNKAISELGWFNNDKKAEVARLYSDLSATVNAIPLPALARGGSFIVPPSFENDSFPITTAMAQSGERVTVETPEQQAGGRATFQIGPVIADPSGIRELERLLNKYGDIEYMRRG